MTPSLLEQVCNNFTVVEVWHKTPGVNTDDEVYTHTHTHTHIKHTQTHTDTAQERSAYTYIQLPVNYSVVSVVGSCEAVPAPVLLGIL